MADSEYSNEGPKCPNPDCGRQYVADDPIYYDEQNFTEAECDQCGETFDVEVYVSTSWTTTRRNAGG